MVKIQIVSYNSGQDTVRVKNLNLRYSKGGVKFESRLTLGEGTN